jgi:outer membrane protein assembly factor BamB
MSFSRFQLLCFFIISGLFLSGCAKEELHAWQTFLPMLGTYSSPRAADLNNDGVLDIVMGAGGKEEFHSDSAVIAIDGASGKLLWHVSGENQFVGSAVFKDVNKDGVPDVFIGGRWAELAAISGADGQIIWRFLADRVQPDPSEKGWFNFTTPQFVPDQDGDGLEDLIIANGGNARVAPGDPNRPAGRILVLSSATGKILANATVPDGKESYMSVLCLSKKDGKIDVLVGTGGETIGGHLYRTTLQNIMSGNISSATVLATSNAKGFIATPVAADITNDGVEDLIINAVEGKMIALDGKNDSLLWQITFPGTEAYTNPAIGYFNEDSIPDVFCNFAIGTFPTLTKSVRFMVDGKTGKIQYQDTVAAFQYASAVAADINGDSINEVLINQAEMRRKQFENAYYSHLMVFDFKNHKQYTMGDTLQATNLASTLWIGDLENDQKLDIIYNAVKYHDVLFDLQKPLGLYIGRIKTNITIKKPAVWGAFMGSDYSNIFRRNK